MQESFISVIVPVYKVELYLSQCIESVLGQTYPHFELLLIDDGSPDRSGAICDEYAEKDSHIRVFHKTNGGVSSARNLGLDEARGEWVVFVDSDDYVDPDYLGAFVNACAGMDLVIQGIRLRGEDGSESESLFEDVVIEKGASAPDITAKNKLFHYGYPVCKLFKTALIRKNRLRFDERLHLHEDHLFVFDYLMEVQSIHLLDRAHYFYCLRSVGSSLSRKMLPCKELLYASDCFLARYERLFPAYRFSPTDAYAKEVKYYFGLSQRVKALYSYYVQERPDRAGSLRFLQKEFVQQRLLYQLYYLPKSLSGRISKYLFLNMPIPLLDKLLRMIVCIFGSIINKKFSIG